MKQYTNIQSTAQTVVTPEINVDTVYVRTNIQDIHDEENPVLWQYDEVQYTLNEYMLKRMMELGAQIEDMKK